MSEKSRKVDQIKPMEDLRAKTRDSDLILADILSEMNE